MGSMRTRILQRLRNRLARQGGFALVAALGMSVVFGTVGTSVMLYSTSGAGHSARMKADQQAFALAEAALNDAYSVVYNASNPTMSNAVPTTTQTLDGGTITWSGTLDQQTNVWTLSGIGTVRSPTHGSAITRTAKGKVALGTSTHGDSNNAVWNYLYSDATTGCMNVGNSVNINVPLYVKGSLCMSNQSSFTGYQLEVGGSLSFANSAQVGTSTNTPVHDVHVGGTCTNCGGRIFSQQAWDTHTDGLTKPPVDLAYWYQNAYPGPAHGCTQGSFPGGFDTNNVMDGSRGTVDLAPNQAYDCKVLDPQGNLVGEIGYTPGSPGTLTISGTIFIDGNISFANLNNIVYKGRATIYASGTVTISNQTTLCGVAGCNSSWDANQNLLAFVAGSSTASTGFSIANNSTFQGAVYAVNDYNEGNSVTMWGPVIARQLFVANSTQNHYVPIGTLMPGMPATYDTVVTLSNQPGSWTS
jgi:Tfp pilus assembly protein PilX